MELGYTTTVSDESGNPLAGIELRCERETAPIVVSEEDGNATFAIVTMHSPGCHYQRCTHLVFSDPRGLFHALNATVYQTNHKIAVLQRREERDPEPASGKDELVETSETP